MGILAGMFSLVFDARLCRYRNWNRELYQHILDLKALLARTETMIENALLFPKPLTRDTVLTCPGPKNIGDPEFGIKKVKHKIFSCE